MDKAIVNSVERQAEQQSEYEEFLLNEGLRLLSAFRLIRCPEKRAELLASVETAAEEQNH